MEKRLLFLIIFLFIFGCNNITGEVVQQATSSEYKVVLINSIVNYLTSPSNSILNINEIKDLLFGYFLTHNNIIDLSGTGYYSQEKLADIYNKAKGTNIPGEKGKWYDVLQTGYKMNTKNSYIGFGYHERGIPGAIDVAPNQITYFIIDPTGYTGLDYSGRNIVVRAADYDQSNTGTSKDTISKARLIVVDRNGNEIVIYNLGGENNSFVGTVNCDATTKDRIYIVEHRQGDLRGAKISSWWP